MNHSSFLYIFSLKEPDFLLIFIVVLDSLKVFKLFRKKCSQLKRWTNVAPTHSKEPLLLTTCHKTHLFKKLNFWKITVLQSQNNIFLPRWFPKSRFLETWQTSAGCAVCPSRMWTSGGQKKSYLQHMNCIWKSRPYKMGGGGSSKDQSQDLRNAPDPLVTSRRINWRVIRNCISHS